jgi:hypothetical protein
MQRIPPAPVQHVTAATTLARLRQDAENQLRILADAGEHYFKREEEVWNRRHGNGQ